MHADVGHTRLEKLGHVLLREPDGFAFEPDVDLPLPVLGLVNDELLMARGIIQQCHRFQAGLIMHEGFCGTIQYCPDLDRAEGVNIGVYLVCSVTAESRIKMCGAEDDAYLPRRLGIPKLDEKRLQIAKMGFVNRFDSAQCKTRADIEQFAAREANHLVMLPPRRIMIADMESDLQELFESLVVHKKVNRAKRPTRPRLADVFDPLFSAQLPLEKNVDLRIPITQKRFVADYAYKNEQLHYIKGVGFARDRQMALKTATNLGFNGNLLSKHPYQSVEQRLIVVARFEEPKVEDQIAEMMHDCNVRLVPERNAKALAEEVRAHARPWDKGFPS